jgi:DnaJ family protein C protein 17
MQRVDPSSFVDAYALLGIERSSTDAEIKSAYRERAREVHPDKNPSPQAATLFHAIKHASEVLLDKGSRAALDQQLAVRAAEQARVGAMDEARQRLRRELESREAEARAAGSGAGQGGSGGVGGGMSELQRLRREGAERRSAYGERLDLERSAAAAALATAAAASSSSVSASDLNLAFAVRARWGEGLELPDAQLAHAFHLCGEVTHVLARKRASAVLLFASAEGAEAALVAPPAGMATARVVGVGAEGGAGSLKRKRGGSEEEGAAPAEDTAAAAAAAAEALPFLEREADVLGRARALLEGTKGN